MWSGWTKGSEEKRKSKANFSWMLIGQKHIFWLQQAKLYAWDLSPSTGPWSQSSVTCHLQPRSSKLSQTYEMPVVRVGARQVRKCEPERGCDPVREHRHLDDHLWSLFWTWRSLVPIHWWQCTWSYERE